MRYTGVVIEESLENKDLLRRVAVVSTKVVPVTASHQTPWLTQWTLHTIEVPEETAEDVARQLSQSLEAEHSTWYADIKNDSHHYIIFRDKVFSVDRGAPEAYEEVRQYGIRLGIPVHQLDFS